ncbi:MAG: NAD(P)/FAD-dependent oxidoreductase [Terriglobales bacterium]
MTAPLPQPVDPPLRVVIIGAGFGGLYAARALRGARVAITLIDRRNHHLFQPLLYQVATGGLAPSNIAYPIRAVVSGQKNTRVLLAEVTAIDTAERRVLLRDGAVSYDVLIVATGATHSYFGHPEWEPLAPGLKTLEDALAMRRRILLAFEHAERETDPVRRASLLRFVIVGGGPTGVELAGAIAEIARRVLVQDFRAIDPRETEVVLVEAGPRLLATFPPDLSAKAQTALERLGVVVRTGAAVTAIQEGMVAIAGQPFAAATVLWAAGVTASPLAASLGVPLDRAGRVPVNADLSVPGHPEVFVIGDVAAAVDERGRPLPGVAPVALQQGRHVASNLCRRLQGKPARPFHYVDKGNLATIGRAAAVADIRGWHLSGLVAWLTWLVVHIFFLIGFRNRLVVALDWAWAYLRFERAARLIVGDREN